MGDDTSDETKLVIVNGTERMFPDHGGRRQASTKLLKDLSATERDRFRAVLARLGDRKQT